jgi:hypothetical protein
MPRMPLVRASFATSRPSIERGTLSGAEWTWMSIVPCSARAAAAGSDGGLACGDHDPTTAVLAAMTAAKKSVV